MLPECESSPGVPPGRSCGSTKTAWSFDVRSYPAGAAAVSLGDHLPHLVVRDLLADLRGSK